MKPRRHDLDSCFLKSLCYAELKKAAAGCVSEERSDPRQFPYTERHLQGVWFDSRWRPASLQSSDGEEVLIENPGRWNMEAGPDFLDASLLVGPDRRRICGDIEIHVNPSDWHAHQHAANTSFQKVIGHVCYFEGTLSADQLPPGTVQIALRKALLSNPSFSFENLDITAYPHASLSPSPPCRAIFSQWSPDSIGTFLDAAGQYRLQIKAKRLSIRMADVAPEQALYEEIMASLGYKQNTALFRRLAKVWPHNRMRALSNLDPIMAYALYMGTTELLPKKINPSWDSSTRLFVRQLWDNWWKQDTNRVRFPASSWNFSSVRPANRPVRRLAAAAVLFSQQKTLFENILAIDTSCSKTWFKNIQDLFQKSCRMDYWTHRLSFNSAEAPTETVLIGTRRIATIMTNVLIPFLATQNISIGALLNRLPPEQDNAFIRQTAHNLFGPDHAQSLYQTGLRQQGLLQVFQDFCMDTKESCRECTLCKSLKECASDS